MGDRASESYREKKFDMAITGFTEAINLDNTKFQYFTNRGMAYYGSGQHKEAYDDAKMSLDLEKTAKGNLLLGIASYRLKKFDEAEQALNTVHEFEDQTISQQAEKWQ